MVASHYTLRRKDLCVLACMFCINIEGERGGGGWGHLKATVHMAATRLGCKKDMVDAV